MGCIFIVIKWLFLSPTVWWRPDLTFILFFVRSYWKINKEGQRGSANDKWSWYLLRIRTYVCVMDKEIPPNLIPTALAGRTYQNLRKCLTTKGAILTDMRVNCYFPWYSTSNMRKMWCSPTFVLRPREPVCPDFRETLGTKTSLCERQQGKGELNPTLKNCTLLWTWMYREVGSPKNPLRESQQQTPWF